MRHLGLALVIAVLASTAWAGEESGTNEARTGEINAYEVNVRAGPHLNYEVLTQLDKGDLVLVTGQRGDWTRIALPPGLLAWVSTKLVADDGLVEADNVNVRSGPALKYNLLCQLKRDQHVVIKETSADGEWYGILPPEAAGAWIYGKFVDDKGAPALYAEWAPRKAACRALLETADRFRNYELKRPEAKIRFETVLANYRRIETDYADMPEARTAKRRIREVEQIKKDVEARLPASSGTTPADENQQESPAADTATTPDTGDETESATTAEQEEATPNYLTAKGVLREISRESTAKGLYRITREDRWICIVKSATLDLGAYAGKSIQVWGSEAPSEGWSLRTIDVSRIKLLE